jgi:hypothetical protein
MQFSRTSYHFIPLRSKYSPQHPVLKHPHCVFLAHLKIWAVNGINTHNHYKSTLNRKILLYFNLIINLFA